MRQRTMVFDYLPKALRETVVVADREVAPDSAAFTRAALAGAARRLDAETSGAAVLFEAAGLPAEAADLDDGFRQPGGASGRGVRRAMPSAAVLGPAAGRRLLAVGRPARALGMTFM